MRQSESAGGQPHKKELTCADSFLYVLAIFRAAGQGYALPRRAISPESSTDALRGKAEPFAQEEDERGKEDAQRHQKVGIEGIAFRPHAVPHPIAVDARFEQAGKHKIQLMIAPRRIVEEEIGQQQDGRRDP